MQLIGMLDSPYVRRVAIAMHHLGIDFEHRPLSVFRNFDEIAVINPVVKVPTLVCDDGTVLLDSSLILRYLETASGNGRMLLPADSAELAAALHLIGIALGGCEKSVQLLYEREHRPEDKQHDPWIERVKSQLLGGFAALETAVSAAPPAVAGDRLDLAGITTAVAWRFAQHVAVDVLDPALFPALAQLSAAAEDHPAFKAAPFGEYAQAGTSAAGRDCR